MTMVRNERFTDYHTLHDLKWPDNSRGADFTSAWARMVDEAYRAGLWFVVAHEVGHLAMGHLDRELNCKDSQDAELAADRYATAMLSFTLTKMEIEAASGLLGEGSDRDTTGAGGYDYFFLVGYSEAFPWSGGDGCLLHPPLTERAELLRDIAARTFQSPIAPKALASVRATHEEWAPGVTAAVSAKCSIDESEATQEIKGTVDALLRLYTGPPIQIGIEPPKEIVKGIWGLLNTGETPDCEGPLLFEFKFRNAFDDGDTSNPTRAFIRCMEDIDEGEHDQAIDDCTQAISLDPKYVLAFRGRADAYANNEQYDRAIQDYDQAISLNPKNFNGFLSRGVANFYAGRFETAAKDFAQGVALNEGYAYGVLWLHLARARSDQNDAEELKNNASRIDLTAWPGPVLSFYLGLLTSDKVTEAAKTGDEKTQRDRSCEAAFILAEAYIMPRPKYSGPQNQPETNKP